jgi:hypothetical protein
MLIYWLQMIGFELKSYTVKHCRFRSRLWHTLLTHGSFYGCSKVLTESKNGPGSIWFVILPRVIWI